MKRIEVVASSDDPLFDWVRSLGFDPVLPAAGGEAVVFEPRDDDPLALAGSRPRVACLPADDDDHAIARAFELSAVLADAYAGSRRTLEDALRFVLNEDRTARDRGPLRLTWLGALGEYFASENPIGTSVLLSSPRLVGRAPEADLCLRQGPHSDQNRVARRHATFEASTEGVLVRDLQTTQGIFVRGERVREALLRPGDEVALSSLFRIRIDGAL